MTRHRAPTAHRGTAPRGGRRNVALGAGGLAVLLGALDTYVVITIITDIMSSVGIAVNQIQQITPIITWYLLGYIAAMPLLGRLSDRYGRKLLLQVSLAGFMVGSVVTALADDLVLMVIGRFVQGTASGAILPVTLALAADLWAQRHRATVLGGIGAAQELGSVLGPVYGIAVVAAFSFADEPWRMVFWINVPLGLLAMAGIAMALPGRAPSDGPPPKVDVVGGLLLAVALGLAVIGLYNPAPDGRQILPSWGPLTLGVAAVVLVAFGAWEYFSRTRLMNPVGVRWRPFACALVASLAAGAALMVTLVDVELFARGVLGKDQNDAVLLLIRFLVALPIGALVGGWLASRIGDRVVACAGLVIAAGGYWLISHWGVDLLSTRHDLGLFTLPALDTDLAIAGVGLGLVIGPLTSAALRAVPEPEHGIASSAVVVSRMIGMLIGVAALSAFGLYRFYQILESLPVVGATFLERAQSLRVNAQIAYAEQYGAIFSVTTVVCLVGAVVALFISDRRSAEAQTDAGADTGTDTAEPAPTR